MGIPDKLIRQRRGLGQASIPSLGKVVAGMNSGHPFPFFPAADPTSGDIRVILAVWNFECGENGGEKRYRCTRRHNGNSGL